MFFYSKFIWGFADRIDRVESRDSKKVTGLVKEKVGSNILKVVLKTEAQPYTVKITPKDTKVSLIKKLLETNISLFNQQTLAQFKKSNIKLLMEIAAEIVKNGRVEFPSKTLKKNAVYRALYHYTVHVDNEINKVIRYKLTLSDGK